MYEIESSLKRYYSITDPTTRKAEFDRVCGECDEEYIKYAKAVFERRHSGKKGFDLAIDKFLYNCVVLISLNKGTKLFAKSHKKEIMNLFTEAGLFSIENEVEECALYWEFRNASARYFETCKSPSYKRKLFGAMNSSDDAKTDFMHEDAYKMSRGIAQRHDMEKELKLWIKAVEDELASLDGMN